MEQRTEVPAPPQPAPRKPKVSAEGSIKDTIESILVAFMLAFIFRAFVVEAFVIPTGSMAPTLLGAHLRYRCPDCGYRFDTNFPTAGDDIKIPDKADRGFTVICPNCAYRVPETNPEDPDNVSFAPAVHYGDRILVLKYLYLFQDPARWDVVVFKSPFQPQSHDYTQNYIKRLVGKPGESVAIIDGDVYIGKGEDVSTFQVQHKPHAVQEALWRIVYDNDYYPRQLPRRDRHGDADSKAAFKQPWVARPGESGWSTGDGAPGNREFLFKNDSAAATIAFDPSANPAKYALTDWLAYDTDTYSMSDQRLFDVSDVKLSAVYTRKAGDGPFTMKLTKNGHWFEAQFVPGAVRLLMDGKPLGENVKLSTSNKPLWIEFANVDYRVSLRVNGDEVIATTPAQYSPDVAGLLRDWKAERRSGKAGVAISADRQECTLSHVSLWRDIYYLNFGNRQVSEPPKRSSEDREQRPEGPKPAWASPENPMTLGPDEYFVLGDNSLVSLDALWNDPINLTTEDLHVKPGVVPHRFMLGKAFFVYWPAGYRPIASAPGIAPNFGSMRFIH